MPRFDWRVMVDVVADGTGKVGHVWRRALGERSARQDFVHFPQYPHWRGFRRVLQQKVDGEWVDREELLLWFCPQRASTEELLAARRSIDAELGRRGVRPGGDGGDPPCPS